MDLAGTLEDNLKAALRSARRNRDHPVHADTVRFWKDLLAYAHREQRVAQAAGVGRLIAELDSELAARGMS